jgi:asparagine synthase (glutamine-hydrolysing)
MCGIAVVWSPDGSDSPRAECVREMLSRMVHRGDADKALSVEVVPGGALGCNRLAIVDHARGHQPMSIDGVTTAFNGEIYNHDSLRRELTSLGYRFATESDTEVLVRGWDAWGVDLPSHLDGMYAFVIYDRARSELFAARDFFGVKPLYVGHDESGGLYLASEMKALLGFAEEIAPIPPGHRLREGRVEQFYRLPEVSFELGNDDEIVGRFRSLFAEAVRKRVQTDMRIAVVFSGGVDSAAILRLACEYHDDVTAVTVGFEGAPDVAIARRYCTELGIPHREQLLDLEDLVRAIPELVYQLETFETVDIMDGSVMGPGFAIVRELGIKIALCGDGSDEQLAGYDFFRSYPDPRYLMRYRLSNLHRTDLQRVDRTSMMHTVEARTPFMDRDLIAFTANVPMGLKLRDGVEKWLLRAAVSDILPDWLAWRPKVRMPEGTGLRYDLLEYARLQESSVDEELLERLGLQQPDGAFFLERYLEAGFPVPRERYKRVGLDFADNGYFAFGAAA